jgi:hypothetical protein
LYNQRGRRKRKEKIQDMTPKKELRTRKYETKCQMLTTRVTRKGKKKTRNIERDKDTTMIRAAKDQSTHVIDLIEGNGN